MSLMALLGYCEGKETVLTRPGDASSAKAALAGAPKPKTGRGIDAGRIVVRARNSTVVAAMFTPKGGFWRLPNV